MALHLWKCAWYCLCWLFLMCSSFPILYLRQSGYLGLAAIWKNRQKHLLKQKIPMDQKVVMFFSMAAAMSEEQEQYESEKKCLQSVLDKEDCWKNRGVAVLDALVCVVIAGVIVLCVSQMVLVKQKGLEVRREREGFADEKYAEVIGGLERCEIGVGPEETALPSVISCLPS